MLYAAFLYCSLAAPDFEVRERASDRLSHLIHGWPWLYGPAVSKWAAEAAEPETRRRASRLVARYRDWLAASYVPSTVPFWPCCDFYPLEVQLPLGVIVDVRCRCVWIVECTPTDVAGPVWTAYRRATERRVRRAIAEGQLTYAESDALLARMWRLEVQYKSDCGRVLTGERWTGGYPAAIAR